MLIIDFHAHITAPEIIARRDEYLIRDAWFRDLYANPKARLSSAEDLISAMDRDSVDQAVVFGFGWRDMDLCRRDNDYVIESVARYPDRLVGFAIVNPQDSSEAVREIERCAMAGLRGVGELMPDGQGYRQSCELDCQTSKTHKRGRIVPRIECEGDRCQHAIHGCHQSAQIARKDGNGTVAPRYFWTKDQVG
jgi:predicted TIM-barrel fold metal-dependent hydrolase